MMQYVEHTIPGETLIDSDRESNKSEEGDVAKEQRMFIWNQKFEVCVCVHIWHAAKYNFSFSNRPRFDLTWISQ